MSAIIKANVLHTTGDIDQEYSDILVVLEPRFNDTVIVPLVRGYSDEPYPTQVVFNIHSYDEDTTNNIVSKLNLEKYIDVAVDETDKSDDAIIEGTRHMFFVYSVILRLDKGTHTLTFGRKAEAEAFIKLLDNSIDNFYKNYTDYVSTLKA